MGQLNYGVLYKLWNPERHNLFGTSFHTATESVLALQRRAESPMSLLPDECVYYILNMCRWDWFDDDARDMKRRARRRNHRLLETAQRQQQDASMHDADDASNEQDGDDSVTTMEHAPENAAPVAAQEWAVQLVQQQLGLEDSSDDEDGATADEDDGSDNESDDESIWERANGYRADNVAFSFRDILSDDSDDDDDENDEAMDVAVAPAARHNWLRSPFAGIHVLRQPRQQAVRAVVEDDSDGDFEL